MIWVKNFNPELHHRRSIRLKNRDYSESGYYFITICCYNRACLFGKIVDNEMILNDYGQIARDEWIKSSSIRGEIELDEFVVMPNHFHAIVKIVNDGRGDRPVAPTNDGIPVAPTNDGTPVAPTNHGSPVAPTNHGTAVAHSKTAHMPNGPKPGSIGSLMAGYKSSVTKQINILRGKPGEKVWQRNYFEKIIRDEHSLRNIRQYLKNNPKNWLHDDFYL